VILLDADVAIEILRGRPDAIAWYGSLPDDEILAMPGYVVMELAAGCINRAELRDLQRWLVRFRILWLPQNRSHEALQQYFEVTLRNAIGVMDFLIAHTALFHAVPLTTFNIMHFRAVRGLRISVPYRR
jgi:predicted nucleic acid-binding protein